MTDARPRLALALGGGAALGFAHIGVLRVLDRVGLRPDLVIGTSMGAIIGAAWCAGRLDEAEALVMRLGPFDILKTLTDLAFVRAGWLKGRRVMEILETQFGDLAIEAMPRCFHALAADLVTGEEVLLAEGRVVDALRASISVPWIFEPVPAGARLLVDGGMRAPVPMLACRRLGAERLIAVHVAGDHGGRIRAARLNVAQHHANRGSKIAALAFALQSDAVVDAHQLLARPDIFIEPASGGLEMHAFHRGAELIAIGRQAAEAQTPALLALREQLVSAPA